MKKFLLLIPMMLLVACSSKVTPSNSGDNTSHDDTSSDSSTDSSSLDPEVYGTVTTVFKGNDGSMFHAGSQLSNDGPKNATIELFDGFCTGLTAASCAYQAIGGNDALTSLTIGSGTKAGNITFTFTHQIVKVDVTLQTYYNSYTSQGVDYFSVDSNSEITIEDTNFTLSVEDPSVAPQEVNKTIELATAKNTINMFNQTPTDNKHAHRVYVHSMTLTYLK